MRSTDQPQREVRHADALPLPLAWGVARQTDRSALAQYLSSIRLSLIDNIWKGAFLISLVGAPVSAMRSVSTGWMPLYTAHIGLAALVCCLYLARRHISETFKTAALVALLWAVGLAGLFTLGLMGSGATWLAVSALLMAALYSVRAGMITIGAVLIAIVTAAIAFTEGFLTVSFEARTYVSSPASWVSLIVTTALLPVIIFQAISSLHDSNVKLMTQVDEQRMLIERMATHDALTSVPTVTLAMDRLEQAMLEVGRTGKLVALLFIDLDGFKEINDRHGHEAGDTILKAVAQRCRDTIRVGDTIARKGGDEFIAILPGIADGAAAEELAQALVSTLGKPVLYRGKNLTIGASIGVALAPVHAETADALVRAADIAMYKAKRAGKNQVWMA